MFKYDYVSHKGLFLRDGLTRATHYTRAHTAPHPTHDTARGTHVREVRTHARTTGPTRCAHRGPHAAQPSRRRRRRGARTGQDAHPQTQERLLSPLNDEPCYNTQGKDREREILPTPYLLIRRGVSSGIQAVWPPRVAVLFHFGRSLLRDQRALSGKLMFWQPYRCTTPGCTTPGC